MIFYKKKVCVLGAGKSGVASAIFLSQAGAEVTLLDDKPSLSLKSKRRLNRHQILFKKNVSQYTLRNMCCIVKSPGVPNDHPIIQEANNKKILIASDIELGYQFAPYRIVAVTGTNGKTTTTSLIDHILNVAHRSHITGGNIGVPYLKCLQDYSIGDTQLLEVSSFQLEHTYTFAPHISILLNIARNHLDRHKSMSQYILCKKKIFSHQKENDFAVLNWDDLHVRDMAKDVKSNKVFISAKNKKKNVYVDEKTIHIRTKKFKGIIDIKECKLKGIHNAYNLASAVLAAVLLEVPVDIIRKAITTFSALPHRCEYIGQKKGVKFINDSKSTTVESAISALNSINGKVVLIAGGIDKGNDYRALKKYIKKKIKCIICLEKEPSGLQEFVRGTIPYFATRSMKKAFEYACLSSKKNDTVLLSPMCASFDLFSNYQDRGKQFVEAFKAKK